MSAHCCPGSTHSEQDPAVYHPFEIALCGLSGSGKTTLLEKLIKHFSSAGYELSCFKHGCHRFDIDREGKDSDRFRKAGATSVLIADREKEALISQGTDRLNRTGLLLSPDMLFIEGLKELPVPKLLLVDHQKAILEQLENGSVPQVLALVHDGAAEELERFGLPLFDRNDIGSISTFIGEFFRKQAEAVPLHGLVLAGGRSSRMGSDKAMLRYHGGNNQMERTASLLAPLCNQVFISCRREQLDSYATTGIPAITDSYLDMGPLGGVLSAQRSHPEAAWLVAACDLPFIDQQTLSSLVAGRAPFRFATSFISGNNHAPEPLLTIYEPKSRRRLLEQHASGNDSLLSFLRHSRISLIEPELPSALINVNDPASMAEALRSITTGESL